MRLALSHTRSNTYHANLRQVEIFRENQLLVRKIAALHINAKSVLAYSKTGG